MDNTRHRLETRRDELLKVIAAKASAALGTNEVNQLIGWRQELATIDQTLAQRETAEAMRRDTAAREADRAYQDDAAYWSRRFNTSLAIGNGAGLALVTSALLQSQHLDRAIIFAWMPMMCFGPGLLCAGALPWVLWAQRRYPNAADLTRIVSALLTTLSAGCFVLAIGSAIYHVHIAQRSAVVIATAERRVEGVELANRVKALGAYAAPSNAQKHK